MLLFLVCYVFVSGICSSDTTFFGTYDDTSGIKTEPKSYHYFGTSASAANVAALALLLLEQNSLLKPRKVYIILQETAIDMNEPGFDFTAGYGFVNRLPAIVQAKRLAVKRKKHRRNKGKKKKIILRKLRRLDKQAIYFDYKPDQH